MKKIFALILILILTGVALAAELQPIAFPFIGKWNPSEDPALIDDYGLQDVQNVRKIGKHFKGIGGHTVINSTSISSYPYFLNGFHFWKDQPAESHVIVSAANSTVSPSASYLYQNTTAIPGTGNFSATTLHTDATAGIGKGRFSMAPAGNMVYSNGAETLIWGGNEIEPISWLSISTTLTAANILPTNPKNYTDAVRTSGSESGSTVVIGSGFRDLLIGFHRPLQGVKLYVSSANVSASTITGAEWTGAVWSALTVTDNTKAAGVSLAQTGTITWPTTVSSSQYRYISGLSLYWYQLTLSAGTATVYYATVDAPPQSIKNIWDGSYVSPAKAMKYLSASSTFVDYSLDVIDDLTTTYLDASTITTADYILIGFTGPQQALNIQMVSGSENQFIGGATSVYYWDGSTWAIVANSDGTNIDGDHPLSRSGVISWNGVGAGVEFEKSISDELPLNYYKLTFSGGLDGDCKIAKINGIPFPPSLPTYNFSETFQNRLFLFNESNGEKNRARYSGANTPDIFNGSDSSYLYFGDKTEIIAAKAVYNVFRTFAADQFIVAKKNETWRVSGDGPTTWVVNRMSDNTGCIAPLSMVTCEVAEGAEVDVKRQVVIWQSDKAFVMTDGAAIIPISDDIRCYFDPKDSRYIPTTRQSKTASWYDPFTRSYKTLISSGSTATYHNIELEYSLVSKEWTKIYREDASGADPLQCGFQVFDTNGLGYTYGGNTKGFMYRLENGATFAGTNITNKIQTKDLILDTQAPLFRKSTAKFMRTAHKKKSGSVTIAHYGDQVLTVSGSTNQSVPTAFSTATTPYNSQSCQLGPFLYHSFLFTSVTSTNDGMELSGLAIYAEPFTVWR